MRPAVRATAFLALLGDMNTQVSVAAFAFWSLLSVWLVCS